MRVFRAADGREWEAVTGRESWGVTVAIFVSRDGHEAPRQALLESGTAEGAEEELRSATDDELRDLLRRSAPWSEG